MSGTDFVFVHINKTGGTSIEMALGLPLDHRTATEKRSQIGNARWNELYSFSFVRNPWDKVVSHYHWRLLRNHSNLITDSVDFARWVKLAYGERDPGYYDVPKMFMPQVEWLSDSEGKLLVSQIGRFERLQADFDAICAHIGRNCRLRHFKASCRGPYQGYYDTKTRVIVEECFHMDIEAFGYSF